MILLALIIVIILFVRKNRADSQKKSSEEGNRETENQENNDQSVTVRSDVYTELGQIREPDSTYMSLVHFENIGDNIGPSIVIGENHDYINEAVITEPQIFSPTSQDYVIPATNNLATLELRTLHWRQRPLAVSQNLVFYVNFFSTIILNNYKLSKMLLFDWLHYSTLSIRGYSALQVPIILSFYRLEQMYVNRSIFPLGGGDLINIWILKITYYYAHKKITCIKSRVSDLIIIRCLVCMVQTLFQNIYYLTAWLKCFSTPNEIRW